MFVNRTSSSASILWNRQLKSRGIKAMKNAFIWIVAVPNQSPSATFLLHFSMRSKLFATWNYFWKRNTKAIIQLQLEVFQGTRFCLWRTAYWHQRGWWAFWRKELSWYRESCLLSCRQTKLFELVFHLGWFVITCRWTTGVNLSNVFQQLE